VKIALNAPYLSSWENYERYDGEITLNGIQHHYVKRKVSGDTLYLLCIPDKKTSRLYAEKGEYSKSVNDFPGNKKEGENSIKKSTLLNQYQEKAVEYSFTSPQKNSSDHNYSLITPLPNSYIELHGKPPELNS